MTIGIVGTRGIPAKYGGFETFAQEVSPLLVKHGFEITVYCDKSETNKSNQEYQGVRLRYQHTSKSKHPLLFYFDGIFLALKENEIVLVTGTGGSFFYFLNFFFRKVLITNTDGLESRRAKWPTIIKAFIKISEILAIVFSDHLIADSKGISQYLLDNYPKLKKNKLATIEYGAPINTILIPDYLKTHQLEENNYFLVVCRLEPENNLQMIIDGYKLSDTCKPLVIVGSLTGNSYVRSLLNHQSKCIRFIGSIYNKEGLSSLRSGAFAYVHGHSVGGTNPSLLEAMGSSNICICHDNIFNREVTDNNQLYFNNQLQLKSRIEELEKINSNSIQYLKISARTRIETYYTWQHIADKYSNLFSSLK